MKKFALLDFAFLSFAILFAAIFIFSAQNVCAKDNPFIKITMMNQDPDPAEAGKYLELRWRVTKYGNDNLENVSFFLQTEFPFYFDGSDTPGKTLGSWQGYSNEDEYYTLYYKVLVDDSAINNTYNIKLKSRLNNKDVWKESEYSIRVNKIKPVFVLGALTSSPLKLVGDIDEAKLTVQLSNIGDGNAENVNTKLILPAGLKSSYSYSDTYNIGIISASETENAIYYIDIPEQTKSGIYLANIEVKYKTPNDDNYITELIPLDIPIMSSPSFEIIKVSTIPEKIIPGDTVQIIITVNNSGSDKAESVSVRAFKETSQPFEFEEKSDFIGKLEAGESGDAVLKLNVDKVATPKSYILDVEIRGIDGEEVIINERVIKVAVVNGEKKSLMQSSLLPGFIIVIVIVGLGLILYKLLKRGFK